MRAILVGLVSVVALAGCGSRSLAPGLVRGDAGPDLAKATDVPDPVEADARCASPTICNDDPSQLTPAGTCTPFGDYWYCECAPGFSINPKTSRCRQGTTCVAAAADEWTFRMPFDVSDCATRTPLSCDKPGQDPVTGALLALPGAKCMMPRNLYVRIEVVAGCPSLLEGRGPGAPLNS